MHITASSPPEFWIDCNWLTETAHRLTLTPDEHVVFVSGVSVEQHHVPTHLVEFDLAYKSPVRAIGDIRSSMEALFRLYERGLPLLATAHRHPGNTANATHESSVDVTYMGALQAKGAPILGIIVTKPQPEFYVRFFTVRVDFNVHIVGRGWERVGDNVIRVDPV